MHKMNITSIKLSNNKNTYRIIHLDSFNVYWYTQSVPLNVRNARKHYIIFIVKC